VSDSNISISRQASNLGNVKGLPKGSGHGGYTTDPEVKHTPTDKLRMIFNNGGVVHLKHKDDDYILNSFLGGDKLECKFICPIKLKAAQKNGTGNLEDIVSSIDTIPIHDVELENVFSDEEDAADYFLMSTEQIEFESVSKFDDALNKFYTRLID
tara:strand:+ start:337 stop:801 length:465 start_codon:yes stop_codon:yes gene_type:complete